MAKLRNHRLFRVLRNRLWLLVDLYPFIEKSSIVKLGRCDFLGFSVLEVVPPGLWHFDAYFNGVLELQFRLWREHWRAYVWWFTGTVVVVVCVRACVRACV